MGQLQWSGDGPSGVSEPENAGGERGQLVSARAVVPYAAGVVNLAKIEENPLVKAIGARMLAVHQWVYESSGGRVGHRVLGVPCLLLRTVGAKTGLQRTNSLTYARDGVDYLVVASVGGAPKAPGWLHNLKAQPEAEAQLGTRRELVTARPVYPDEEGYDRLWDLVNKGNHGRYRTYQRATTRPIPVVVLSPRS